MQINNQSTQHNATGVKVKYSYDEGYEYVGDVEGTVNDEKNKILTISNINLVPGESKKITLKFKVRKNEDGTFLKNQVIQANIQMWQKLLNILQQKED